MPESLVIIGASVRAAAFSAIRAGFKPWCVDLFADRDLAAVCPARRVPTSRYPKALFEAVADAPPGPWMYTGGLENYPDLIDELAANRPLWGNPGAVLRKVRDPFRLREALVRNGLSAPECRRTPEGLPTDGSWLVKPLRGSGGRGIARYLGTSRSLSPRYWQRFIPGESVSAIYCADDRLCDLLGVTRQLVGDPAFHAGAFEYCGSVSLHTEPLGGRYGLAQPPMLEWTLRLPLGKIGDVVADEFGVRGLFGVDAVMSDGQPHPVEVNPRYPASVEVVENAAHRELLLWHAAAFGGGEPESAGLYRGCVGKAVVYAAGDRIIPDTDAWMSPPYRRADVPGSGSRIARGRPVTTVFAFGADPDETYRGLVSAAAEVDRQLTSAPSATRE